MVLPLLLAVSLAEWVPARWPSNDPKSLELLAETPINCLLIEEPWSEPFVAEASSRGLVTLGVIRPGGDTAAAFRRAAAAKLTGVVLEGEFEPAARDAAGLTVLELPPRARMRLDGVPIAGTTQGLWPGIHVEEGGKVHAAPTGGPWIDTNTGFLRYVRAATELPIWIGNTPPAKPILTADRYLQAIGDSAMSGARWIIALDPEFARRLLARDAAALRDWRRIAVHLKFYEDHKEWRAWPAYARLALVQDLDNGALISGGVLDMIAVKHTPVRPVPRAQLAGPALEGASMAVNVDPAALSDAQKEALRGFARRGGTVLSGPPGWKFPAPRPGQITLEEKELTRLDDIWRDMNSMIGRRNLGARLFNVSSMLSTLVAAPGDKQVVLHLVNYSNYTVENITAHLLGKFTRARFYTPESAPRDLETYPVEEGTGVDIDKMAVCGALVLDRIE